VHKAGERAVRPATRPGRFALRAEEITTDEPRPDGAGDHPVVSIFVPFAPVQVGPAAYVHTPGPRIAAAATRRDEVNPGLETEVGAPEAVYVIRRLSGECVTLTRSGTVDWNHDAPSSHC